MKRVVLRLKGDVREERLPVGVILADVFDRSVNVVASGVEVLRQIDLLEAEDIDVDNFYVDLKAAYDFPGSRYQLSLVGLNVFDDQELVGIGRGVAGFVFPKGATWEICFRATF